MQEQFIDKLEEKQISWNPNEETGDKSSSDFSKQIFIGHVSQLIQLQ